MPTLDQHESSLYTKLLYIGDSSVGKTGSLVSLVEAGYKFKIIDMDNGLEILKGYVRQQCPQFLQNIEYETYRDQYKSMPNGMVVKGTPKAFTNALGKLTEWSTVEDTNTVFVLDSLSATGKAAFEWAKNLNPAAKDPRNWYNTAQQAIENMLSMLTSAEFKMNVIVISHVNYKEVTEGVHKGYANAIGTALGPVIPRYFNTLVLAESSGSGKNTRRKIKTMPTGVIDLKTAAPTKIDAELPLESGMAQIFSTLKEH